jgi:hypothetical protein
MLSSDFKKFMFLPLVLFTSYVRNLKHLFFKIYSYVILRWQVRLIRLVRLQTDNFHLFLHQLTDKQQTSVCTMSKW